MTWKSFDVTREKLRRWHKALIATGGALLHGMIPMIATFVIGAAIMAALVGPMGPEWLSFAFWQDGGVDTSRSEVLRNVGLLIVGAVGLFFGIWRAWTAHQQAQASVSQARIAQQYHVTDRFSAAVEHLGSKELPVRLGGIYALWRLAEDSSARDEKAIWDILCAFIRHPPHEPEPDTEESAPVRPDIQTILDLLTTDATARRMKGVGYSRNLKGSRLCKANLSDANLSDADLSGANLSGTNLSGANLRDAELSRADLCSANLFQANLYGAELFDANLSSADVSLANLSCVMMNRVNLSGADLTAANLSRAHMVGADLSFADISDANLSGTFLRAAKNLIQEQLDTACISKGEKKPRLPDGLTAPTNVCDE